MKNSRGLTLIELLAAISVVLVLLAILMVVAGNIRLTATKTKDTSNLRQIGVALNLYLVDNNQLLPVSWVSLPANPAVRNRGDWQPFSGHLAPYLGVDVPNNTKVFMDVFQSPAWPEQLTPAEALAAGSHNTYRLVLGGLGNPNPFGGKQEDNGGNPIEAQRVITLEREFGIPASEFPIVYNHDQQLPFSQPGAPEERFFGSGRNVLFLDGRVSFVEGEDFLRGFR
jgi:prepilin-type N-terminal cleavage/methylation domain-containing protein/prepilin-type processing-associated H-X9-DG protein